MKKRGGDYESPLREEQTKKDLPGQGLKKNSANGVSRAKGGERKEQ